MTREPGFPHKPKWGDRTAARAGEAEYLIGIGAAGYTCLKDAVAVEVHGSVADGAGARRLPGNSRGPSGREVSAVKPRAGAYYRYMKIKKHRA